MPELINESEKCKTTETSRSRHGPYTPALIIHGGAGAISRATLPPELYAQYHASLLSYLKSTQIILAEGATAVTAACHAVGAMEDDPLFNCGRGSVFTEDGDIEMEASLAVASIDDSIEYEGKIKRSAAVSMIRRTRHPILLAREALIAGDEEGGFGGKATMHGHLSGSKIEEWGWKRGLEKKGKRWFWTKRRWEEHRRGLKQNGCEHDDENDEEVDRNVMSDEEHLDDGELTDSLRHAVELPSQGTVGAVCMDSWGVIAVATSTGGLTNKRSGRIGDTPTIGAGFWAESWAEDTENDPNGRTSSETYNSVLPLSPSFSKTLATSLRAEIDFWLGCFDAETSTSTKSYHPSSPLLNARYQNIVESEPIMLRHCMASKKSLSTTQKSVIAMSGTGNGDSFLRTNACRTAAAICRFSIPSMSVPLSQAIRTITGPGGELQRSAGDRWQKTGEGEGGIIGIELISAGNTNGEANVVFDFNCGGMWRAYFEKDDDGHQIPRVMVFRDEYKV